MKKEESIKRYGEDEYQRRLLQACEWKKEHPESTRASDKKYREGHPEVVIATHRELTRKGGKYYERMLIYNRTGLQGERNRLRKRHANKWRKYKRIIAPDSQIHHQWVPNSAKYTGLALVETDQHMCGFIDVIKMLEGEITLFTEKEVREKGGEMI